MTQQISRPEAQPQPILIIAGGFENLMPVKIRKNDGATLTRLFQEGPFIVVEGYMKVTNADGEVLQVLGPGEVAGLETSFAEQDASPFRARSLTPTLQVGLFPKTPTARAWIESHPEVLQRVVKELSQRALAAQVDFHRMKRPLPERSLLLLADLERRYGVAYGQFRMIGAPLTKIELASMLGSTQESVVRVFSEWRKQGLIAPHGKQIIILKPEELAE